MAAVAVVHIIDDDEAVRASLRLLLESAQLTVADYASADVFLANVDGPGHGCIISDLQMPGLSGLDLQQMLAARGIDMPMIMLTGHADVPSAVRSLKAGAVDYIEKPFQPSRLLEQVHSALALDRQRQLLREQRAHNDAVLGTLTPREDEVLRCVATGMSNKVIAIEREISERTVELHRGRGMKKLGVRTVPELIRLLDTESTADDGRQ